MKEAQCFLHLHLINYLTTGIPGNPFNILNALMTEAIAACTGAIAEPAPGTTASIVSTVFKVPKTVVSKVDIIAIFIIFSFNKICDNYFFNKALVLQSNNFLIFC